VPTAVTRLAGPVLLVGAVAAVWLGVGLGPLASPQTKQAATAREVAAPEAIHPTSGTVVAFTREGDRLLLTLRSDSATAHLELTPGVTVLGTTLAALADSAGLRVRLAYAADGSVTSITAD
jgi:hypothetical protein